MIRRVSLVLLGGALLAAILARWVALRDEARLAVLPADARAAWQPALAWLPPTPTSLRLRAQAAPTPAAAAAAWRAAHQAQPTAADPLFALADHHRQQGDPATADQLVAAAVRLAPAYARTHLRAAAYWAAREDVTALLQALSQTLILDPPRRPALYPLLTAFLTHPPARDALGQLAREHPPWWPGFFRHVARHAPRAALDTLYALRRQEPHAPLTPREREAYVQRLLHDDEPVLAYLHWIGGLSRTEREHLGLLFNGSFDLPVHQPPFGWVVRDNAPFRVRTVATAGVRGSAALELRFHAFTARFDHLRQRLLLDPGAYQLRGRVRVDALRSPAGLRWQLECLPRTPREQPRRLAASTPWLGTTPWQTFELAFTVPADCPQQVVKLVAAGQRPFEYRLDGGIWFDQFSLRRDTAADPAAAIASGGGEPDPADPMPPAANAAAGAPAAPPADAADEGIPDWPDRPPDAHPQRP